MRIDSLCWVAMIAAGLGACAKGNDTANAGADTAGGAGAGAAAASPEAGAPSAGGAGATLTAGALDGMWNGETKFDTATTPQRWTARIGEAKVVTFFRDSTDSLAYRATYAGDSLVTVSDTFRLAKNGPILIDRAVNRMQGGRIVGAGRIVRANAPDSVVARYSFEATRAAPKAGGS